MNIHLNRQIINFFQMITLLLLAQPVMAQDRPEPEIATQTLQKQEVKGGLYMAVTANPLATKAAENILAQGGSAADAAIAAQLVLGLVEPQSSGLGGGAFALYYDAKTGKLSSWDARETAPMSATPDLFMREDGSKMDFYEAVIGGRSVGVPGTPALIHKLYKRYGKLPSEKLFAPAIKLAEEGFAISPRLAMMIESDKGKLDQYAQARSYFYNEDGNAKAAGTMITNEAYAQTVKNLGERGLSYFYQDLAPAMAALVQEAGGLLSAADFAAYEVKERAPVCAPYRAYKICAMGEPSSGGLTLLQMLGMLERFDLSAGPTARNLHLIAEASRLAFADRNEYMADPDFVSTKGTALIAPSYIAKRSALINEATRQEEIMAGDPDREGGTSHITIVDSEGNVLSMTTTIEGAFGSKLMTNGFMLNNELTDFNFEPGTANSVEAGKRPRSSMAPTIIFDEQGQPFMALGSAGGSRIIGFVLQRIVAVIDWNMGIQDALAMNHILARSDVVELETGYEAMAPELGKFGHKAKIGEMSSGLTAILFDNGFLLGAADPRREGTAAGQ